MCDPVLPTIKVGDPVPLLVMTSDPDPLIRASDKVPLLIKVSDPILS